MRSYPHLFLTFDGTSVLRGSTFQGPVCLLMAEMDALLEGVLTGVELAAVACLLLDVMLQLHWL